MCVCVYIYIFPGPRARILAPRSAPPCNNGTYAGLAACPCKRRTYQRGQGS